MHSWPSITFRGVSKHEEDLDAYSCYIKAGIEDVNKATNKETYQSFGSLLSRFARF